MGQAGRSPRSGSPRDPSTGQVPRTPSRAREEKQRRDPELAGTSPASHAVRVFPAGWSRERLVSGRRRTGARTTVPPAAQPALCLNPRIPGPSSPCPPGRAPRLPHVGAPGQRKGPVSPQAPGRRSRARSCAGGDFVLTEGQRCWASSWFLGGAGRRFPSPQAAVPQRRGGGSHTLCRSTPTFCRQDGDPRWEPRACPHLLGAQVLCPRRPCWQGKHQEGQPP